MLVEVGGDQQQVAALDPWQRVLVTAPWLHNTCVKLHLQHFKVEVQECVCLKLTSVQPHAPQVSRTWLLML